MVLIQYKIEHPDFKDKNWHVEFSSYREKKDVWRKFLTKYKVLTNDGEQFKITCLGPITV